MQYSKFVPLGLIAFSLFIISILSKLAILFLFVAPSNYLGGIFLTILQSNSVGYVGCEGL